MSEPFPLPATPTRRRDGRALGAALVTVALWASAFVGIRAAGEDLSAGPLTLLRLAIGSVALGVLVLALARRDPLPTRRDIPGLLVFGLLWFGAYNVMRDAAGARLPRGCSLPGRRLPRAELRLALLPPSEPERELRLHVREFRVQ